MQPEYDNREQEMEALESETHKRFNVLVVDDDRTACMMLQGQIEDLGYKVTTAVNGKDAYDILQQNKDKFNIILLDREMPEMNGMEVIRRMKSDRDLRRVPIIMATASNMPAQVKEGIDAGVFYYLTKPINPEILKSVFLSAVRELETRDILKEELKKHKSSFRLIHSATFYVRTIDEAEDLAAFLANGYPDPERVISGLAELIINGIEHGNIGISYDEKTDLIKRSIWRQEIKYRCSLPEHKDKRVQVRFNRNPDGLYVEIEDQGAGFEWQRFLDIDPSRSKDNHGRGIAQARAVSFDDLEYNTSGNVVTAIVQENKELEW